MEMNVEQILAKVIEKLGLILPKDIIQKRVV